MDKWIDESSKSLIFSIHYSSNPSMPGFNILSALLCVRILNIFNGKGKKK